MPPIAPKYPYSVEGEHTTEQQDYAATVNILVDGFCRLFAAARRLEPSSRRGTLQLIIANELDRLRKTEKADPKSAAFWSAPKELFQYVKTRADFLDPALTGMLNLNNLIQTANTKAELDYVESVALKPALLLPN